MFEKLKAKARQKLAQYVPKKIKFVQSELRVYPDEMEALLKIWDSTESFVKELNSVIEDTLIAEEKEKKLDNIYDLVGLMKEAMKYPNKYFGGQPADALNKVVTDNRKHWLEFEKSYEQMAKKRLALKKKYDIFTKLTRGKICDIKTWLDIYTGWNHLEVAYNHWSPLFSTDVDGSKAKLN